MISFPFERPQHGQKDGQALHGETGQTGEGFAYTVNETGEQVTQVYPGQDARGSENS